jgi:hypothetical protein
MRSTEARATHGAKTVAGQPRYRRTSSPAYTVSSARSHTTSFIGLALFAVAVGLLLVGAVLIPADLVPWPEPARLLSEWREGLTLAGLAVLAASAVWFLLLFMA